MLFKLLVFRWLLRLLGLLALMTEGADLGGDRLSGAGDETVRLEDDGLSIGDEKTEEPFSSEGI